MIIKDAKSMYLPTDIDFKIFDNFQEEVVVYEIINDILDEIGDLRVKYINDVSINSQIFISNEIIGKTATELYDNDISSLHLNMANQILKSGEGKKYRAHFKELGKYYSVSAYSPDENTYITISTDITELKKEEKQKEELIEQVQKFSEDLKVSNKELQATTEELWAANEELRLQGDNLINLNQYLLKSEAQYKSLAENMPSVLMKYDKDLRILYLSPNAEEIIGISNNEFISKTNREVGIPEYLCNLWENAIIEVFKTGENRDLEFDFPSAEGSRTFYLKLAPELDQDGKVNHVLGISNDITKHKNAERQKQKLLEQVKELTADLENSNKELQISTEELQRSKEELEVSNEELRATTSDLQVANEELRQQREKLKNLNHNLQESEAQYKSLARNLPAVIMRYDRDFRVVYISPNSGHATDISTEQFIGKTSRELGIPEEICDKWESAIEKVFETGENQDVEFEFPATDGGYPKTFYINFTPESDGKSIGYVLGISTEISELKNTQRKLKKIHDTLEQKVEDRTEEIRIDYEALEREMDERHKMEERLLYQANLLESVNDAVIAVDTDFKITSWNKAAQKIYGWNFEEVFGKDSLHILRIKPSDEDKEEIIHSIAEKGIFNKEIIHQRKEGTPVYIGSTVMELKDINNDIIGYIAVNRDISKRKKVQEELKETIENLKRSNEELERFAYVASHDLQEPLRTIASFTQLLERRYKGKFDSDADEFMDYIVEAAKRMKEQIEGLLEYSRVATKGKEFQSIYTNSILDHVINNLKVSIEEYNGEVTHDTLPNIKGDTGQLQRVFQNLISNALKFSKEDEPPKVHISACEDPQNNEYIFSVSDNGIGIEEQYMERIFVIFQRLHTREKYMGTGIGLSIVKKIIERHGGRVWVESEFKKGSTFYFTLPINL